MTSGSASASAAAAANTYYVAPDGNDGAAGTQAAPWASIARAQAVAKAGDTVCFRGGTYAYTRANSACPSQTAKVDAITLNKSGSSGNPIRYWAQPGEKPVFDFSRMTDNCRLKGFNVTGSCTCASIFGGVQAGRGASLPDSYGAHPHSHSGQPSRDQTGSIQQTLRAPTSSPPASSRTPLPHVGADPLSRALSRASRSARSSFAQVALPMGTKAAKPSEPAPSYIRAPVPLGQLPLTARAFPLCASPLSVQRESLRPCFWGCSPQKTAMNEKAGGGACATGCTRSHAHSTRRWRHCSGIAGRIRSTECGISGGSRSMAKSDPT
ncbi:right-handed parallel beta-helix repeat-containing protein [Streptomyces luteogriseus]|uniref:right-handed parallel beta-helix repeat-containing protein n=1 Tax=Streptomyces luteogriseus TaxID=68233 RepID=UPI0037902D28